MTCRLWTGHICCPICTISVSQKSSISERNKEHIYDFYREMWVTYCERTNQLPEIHQWAYLLEMHHVRHKDNEKVHTQHHIAIDLCLKVLFCKYTHTQHTGRTQSILTAVVFRQEILPTGWIDTSLILRKHSHHYSTLIDDHSGKQFHKWFFQNKIHVTIRLNAFKPRKC